MEPVPVLHLVPDLSESGAERILLEMLSRLDRGCFRVLVVTTAAVPSPAARQACERAAVGTDHLALALPPAGGPRQWLAARIEVLRRLRDYLRAARPRIVHTHGVLHNAYGTLAASLAGVPHIMTHDHDLLPTDAPGLGLCDRWVHRWTARLPDVAFVSSHAVEAAYRRASRPGSERVLCLPGGVDLRRFVPATAQERTDARAALRFPSDSFVVGTCGRLVERKRLDVLVDALPLLAAAVPQARLAVIGDGPERTRLEGRARDLGVDDRAAFVGWRSQVLPAYHACDAFVALGDDHGGSGRTLAEALACGLPVVTTASPSHAEIATAGAARLAAARPHQLARELIALASSADGRARLASGARHHAVRHLDIEGAARLLENTYAHCVARTPRPWVVREALAAP